MSALLALGAVVAVAAAARSTWSPCGLSMLSTITPFGERARAHRYAATASWFVLGAVAGGATLGAAGAGMAAALGALAPAPAVRLTIAAALCGAAALVDAGAFGPVLPLIRRQVDDRWLSRYRPWVYGAGFGWQIGVGFATYLMTAGVAVVLALGALTGSPAAALLLGVVFGLARGGTVFLTAKARTPGALRSIHARLDRLEAAVRYAAAGVQAGGALGLALAAAGVAGSPSSPAAATLAAGAGAAVALASALAGALLTSGRRRRHDRGHLEPGPATA